MNAETLIQRYLTGEASRVEVEELDRLLADDPVPVLDQNVMSQPMITFAPGSCTPEPCVR